MRTIEKIIGENIRRRRAEMNWSQSDLASAAKISIQTVSILENGKRGAQKKNLKAIADAFKCSEADLMEGFGVPSSRTFVIGTIAQLLHLADDEELKDINQILAHHAPAISKARKA